MGEGIIYRNYGDTDACGTLDEFVLERVGMDAALVGGMRDAAVEYTWAVSDDDGMSYRNPTHTRSARSSARRYGNTVPETSTARGTAS